MKNAYTKKSGAAMSGNSC